MQLTVAALLAPGKGVLAADEGLPTIEKRFKAARIPVSEENRRAYREMLFSTPGLNEFISGVILFDETFRQKTADGVPLADLLVKQGIVPGIKVDRGTTNLANFVDEKITRGLDFLRERLIEYRQLGARFTKWRAVITIGNHLPTLLCIQANARSLALFAALSQEAGLVPIVEPEVLMDGDHTLERCEEITGLTLKTTFDLLMDHRVVLEQMLLKTGMVLTGTKCPQPAGVAEVAEATLRCLRCYVPAAVPGILFLSGGQRDVDATERLNAICGAGPAPWTLSFSFGRALQSPALKTWKGAADNVRPAQTALQHRAQCNAFAVRGRYTAQIAAGMIGDYGRK